MAIQYEQREESLVRIDTGKIQLEGVLRVPFGATGAVVFASGSGSSRRGRRNHFLADHLNRSGFATLLMDLLTEDEERRDIFARRQRFDIDFLAERLSDGIDFLRRRDQTRGLPTGLLGSSTGAAAALAVCAQDPGLVSAIVSRGGRPDLADGYLEQVTVPTLLIVGGYDIPVIDLNRAALETLRCEKRLEIVPGATHLFEEPGALEDVAHMAAEWFLKHLSTK